MVSAAKSVKFAVSEYGQRSNIHGFSHWHQATSKYSKFFWLLMSLTGVSLCCYHVYHSLSNFYESPVESSFFRDKAPTKFPDVTFCNLKAIGDSMLATQREEIYKHLEEKWGFFDKGNWLNEYRYGSLNSSENRVQFSQVFQALMQVFWVSDDTQDIGMSKTDVMLVFCFYNNQNCSSDDFVLVQNAKYWNCFTFKPKNRTVLNSSHDAGLKLVLFTDSALNRKIRRSDTLSYLEPELNKNESEPFSFRKYLELETPLSKVMSGMLMEGSGVRILVHPHDSYPFISKSSLIAPCGQRLAIEFTQTNYQTINHDNIKCFDGMYDDAEFVTSFGSQGSDVTTQKFRIDQSILESQLQQEFIYKNCKCYSHMFPFNKNMSELCFFVPRKYRLNPPQSVLDKMMCHSNFVLKAENIPIQEFDKISAMCPCGRHTYDTTHYAYKWPVEEDLVQFVNIFLQAKYHKMINHNKFDGLDERNTHIIKNQTMKRYEIIFQSLLDQKCGNKSTEGKSLTQFWCSTPDKLMENFAFIHVKPKDTVAGVYHEHNRYQWPEILSEIGGTLGLWLGLTIMTFAEVLECFTLCFCNLVLRRNIKPKEKPVNGDLCNDHEIVELTTAVVKIENDEENDNDDDYQSTVEF